MRAIKANSFIALALGALISAGLIAIEGPTDFAYLSLEIPGISAAYLFWGAAGSSPFMGIAIAFVVNALVYGAGAFALISLARLLREWTKA